MRWGRTLWVAAAYGNADTDITAYEANDVPKDHTFIIGLLAGKGGTQPLTSDYQSHLGWVMEQPLGNFGGP